MLDKPDWGKGFGDLDVWTWGPEEVHQVVPGVGQEPDPPVPVKSTAE